jgi:RNA polymerase sigma-70 factor (ECF subfamily)
MSALERIAKLHQDHSAVLMRFLMGYSRGEPQTAEDLFQETMFRAWRHIDSVPLEFANARRWLYIVARRITIDVARMRSVRPLEVSMSGTPLALPADDTTEETVIVQAIVTAFRSLKPEHRRVLTELHLNGRSVAEISQKLRLPAGTVKSRAYYGLRSLREALDLPAEGRPGMR